VRRFGERVAVDGIGFEIAAGETYGLLGPNGAGKTTTISMVAGVLEPDAGTVTVGELAMSTGAAAARVGLVPQDRALYADLTAVENLHFVGRLQGPTRPSGSSPPRTSKPPQCATSPVVTAKRRRARGRATGSRLREPNMTG
jgi:ABC-type multidrug transport system ATPase subunit